MKRLLVIYEGASDGSLDELEGSTPLALARNNNASVLVGRGACGLLDWSSDDTPSRLEYKLATILGVAHEEARQLRRGPVEAAGTKAARGSWTYAYRGNFVPVDDGKVQETRVAGLTNEETDWLADVVRDVFKDKKISIEVLGDARVSVMFDQLSGRIESGSFPNLGADASMYLNAETPANSDRDAFMSNTAKMLPGLSINDVRVDLGENPASMIWLWGGGPPVEIGRPFLGAPLKAAMITNSPLAKGMAKLFGMDFHPLGNVWEETPNPQMIGAHELKKCIDEHELTIVYVEAPREGGAYGSAVEKVKGIDRVDIHVLGTMLKALDDLSDARVIIAALPEDGVQMEQTPMLLCGKGVSADKTYTWDEVTCGEGALGVIPAERCLTKLIGE